MSGLAAAGTMSAMSERERIPFVGGPMDGQTYEWTTARAVLIPDATDRIMVWNQKWNEVQTLFGEHCYEMKCYAKGDERRYQLEHVSYTKPTIPAGCVEFSFEPPPNGTTSTRE